MATPSLIWARGALFGHSGTKQRRSHPVSLPTRITPRCRCATSRRSPFQRRRTSRTGGRGRCRAQLCEASMATTRSVTSPTVSRLPRRITRAPESGVPLTRVPRSLPRSMALSSPPSNLSRQWTLATDGSPILRLAEAPEPTSRLSMGSKTARRSTPWASAMSRVSRQGPRGRLSCAVACRAALLAFDGVLSEVVATWAPRSSGAFGVAPSWDAASLADAASRADSLLPEAMGNRFLKLGGPSCAAVVVASSASGAVVGCREARRAEGKAKRRDQKLSIDCWSSGMKSPRSCTRLPNRARLRLMR